MFQVLNTITEDILGHKGSFRNPVDQVELIKQRFESGGEQHTSGDESKQK